MTLNPAYAKSYVSALDLSQPLRTVAVVGGANGIGEGIVRTLGGLGCRVIILGRDERNAKKIEDEVKTAKPRGDVAQISFIKCDLFTVAGMRAAVDEIGVQCGELGLDSIIMCQGGRPSGEINLSSDGHEKGFAVQSLSRFIMTHRVITSKYLRTGGTVVWVANSGFSLDSLSVDDLSLIKRAEGRWKLGLFTDQSFRDSTVLDSINAEFNRRFPAYSFYLFSPGGVKTSTFDPSMVPFPINWISWFMLLAIGRTPEQFAPIPIYTALCDPAERSKMLKDKTMGRNLQASRPGRWASDAGNRAALWDKLSELV